MNTELTTRPTRRQLLGMLGANIAQPALGALAKPPNIVFIMSDDHAAHAISAYGSRINRTPNLDRIAQGGMRMLNCFCTNSICTPSRGAIMTGQYSHINGVKTLADGLDGARPNLAKHMRAAGYQTAMIGKWHLKNDPSGFDYWNILPGQGLYHNPEFIEMGQRKKHLGYCTDLIADFSIDWLRRREPGKPFFLMCHHKAPHRPWQPDAKHANMYEGDDVPEPENLYDDYRNRSHAAANTKMRVGDDNNATDLKVERPAGLEGRELRKWAYQRYIKDYLRCVASVDDNVGRVLDYLDAEKLSDNTLVVYTSDQGFFLGDHGYYDKRFMYEESLRMPFLARLPGRIAPGSVSNDIVLNIDFAPTFLDLAGRNKPAEMQGRSFRSILSGKTPRDWRTSMYYRYWMHLAEHRVPAHYGVRTKRHKLIYYYGKALGSAGAIDKDTEPEWEMFDLEKDPREMKNVYADPSYAAVRKTLKATLEKHRRVYQDSD